MKYAQMRQYDIANGPGVRASLFFSGCTYHCKNCFNQDFQDFNYGEEWTSEAENLFIKYAQNEHVAGVSILGGEPLQQDPQKLCAFLKRLKEEVKKPIWLWTGYTYEKIPAAYQDALKYIDVIIDGLFIESLKNAKLYYRGSSNQRVIDNIQSLIENKVIEKEVIY